MSKLLNSLSAPKKTAYQSYLLEHGIERMTILIPTSAVSKFEASFASAKKDKDTIVKLVADVGGKMKV